MSQNRIVLAFRKRLSMRGYSSVHIHFLRDDVYLVSAFEPLAGFGVSCEMSLAEMYHSMR